MTDDATDDPVTITERLIRYARARGNQPFCARDAADDIGHSRSSVSSLLGQLCKISVMRRLPNALVSDCGHKVHGFVLSECSPPPPMRVKQPGPEIICGIAQGSGPWPSSNSRTEIRNGVKVTICPSATHDRRWQLPPGQTPFGAGFAAVGIGRDIDTGRQWA